MLVALPLPTLLGRDKKWYFNLSSFENEKNSLFILAHHRHVTHLVSARFNVSSPKGHDRQAHLIPSIQ